MRSQLAFHGPLGNSAKRAPRSLPGSDGLRAHLEWPPGSHLQRQLLKAREGQDPAGPRRGPGTHRLPDSPVWVDARLHPLLAGRPEAHPRAKAVLEARILQWAAVPFSRGSSGPRDQTRVSCTAGGFFTTEPPGKPLTTISVK